MKDKEGNKLICCRKCKQYKKESLFSENFRMCKSCNDHVTKVAGQSDKARYNKHVREGKRIQQGLYTPKFPK